VAPPVGPLRWRAPEPEAPWQGVRDAAHYGAACPQPSGHSEPWAQVGQTSEDCLFLNVWRPDTEAKNLPVMVFIHGGGFTYGSAGVPLYEGASLARRGVVLVTLNYRLGRLGFFAHPALTAEDPEGRLGNYGVMDAVAALQWVQRNAAVFGGDANNVTLFGESAGAGITQILMSSPDAAGLFQKAISQSGAGGAILPPIRGTAPNAAETAGEAWAMQAGLQTATVAQLRALPADAVATGRGFPFIDGRVVRASPGAPFVQKTEAGVPLMIGANSNEATLLGTNDTITRMVFGASYESVVDRYAVALGVSRDAAATELREDTLSLQPSMFIGEMHAASGAPVFAYNFRQVRSDVRVGSAGSGHGDEMEFLFGNTPAGQVWDDADRQASRLMGDYWVRFARTGNPNGDDAPVWRPMGPGDTAYLKLDAAPGTLTTTPLEDEVRARALAVSRLLWARQ
jgi:para-nitrobenzyl esterase